MFLTVLLSGTCVVWFVLHIVQRETKVPSTPPEIIATKVEQEYKGTPYNMLWLRDTAGDLSLGITKTQILGREFTTVTPGLRNTLAIRTM